MSAKMYMEGKINYNYNYNYYLLHNNPEEHSSHILCGGSLKSCLDKQACVIL